MLYQISLALNFQFSGVGASFDNNRFVCHLKRSRKNGQSWMLPDEENMDDDQMDQVLQRYIKVSYPSSAGQINCNIDNKTVKFKED